MDRVKLKDLQLGFSSSTVPPKSNGGVFFYYKHFSYIIISLQIFMFIAHLGRVYTSKISVFSMPSFGINTGLNAIRHTGNTRKNYFIGDILPFFLY